MLFLLRQIRRKLLMKNQFIVYLLYAIGEIVLVVVGILIAVRIDAWNKEKEDRKKEVAFLKEIHVNLQEDTTLVNQLIIFDSLKVISANQIFAVFGSKKSEFEMMIDATPHFDYLFAFQVLSQSRTAFDNMLSAESIGIVSDRVLRTKLSRYYNWNFDVEERVKELTRSTRDLIVPMLWNEQRVKYLNPGLTVKQPKDAIKFYENPEVFSMIHGSKLVSQVQLSQAREMKSEALEIIRLIDEQIANKDQ